MIDLQSPKNIFKCRGGSQIIWIAPSGGRDRPDPVTEEWHPVSLFTFVFMVYVEKGCVMATLTSFFLL